MATTAHLGNSVEPSDQTVGRYRLVRRIAAGGMGEVFEARHEVVGSSVAVKFLRADLIEDPRYLERFRREACAAGALRHEGIAAVLDIHIECQRPFIVMELIDGESLASLIHRHGQLSVPRAAGLVLQASDALQVAHSHGVIHRDLKPENLMVTRRADGRDWLKVLDFGVARLVGSRGSRDITTTGAVLGTPHYMSPEQARGSSDIGTATDIYALGAILYELLSGAKAHPGRSYNEIIGHVLLEEVVPLATLRPTLPTELLALVDRAMSRDASNRPASMKELGLALRAFVPDQVRQTASSTADTQATTPERPRRGGGRVRAAAAGALLLVAGFALGRMWANDIRPEDSSEGHQASSPTTHAGDVPAEVGSLPKAADAPPTATTTMPTPASSASVAGVHAAAVVSSPANAHASVSAQTPAKRAPTSRPLVRAGVQPAASASASNVRWTREDGFKSNPYE